MFRCAGVRPESPVHSCWQRWMPCRRCVGPAGGYPQRRQPRGAAPGSPRPVTHTDLEPEAVKHKPYCSRATQSQTVRVTVLEENTSSHSFAHSGVKQVYFPRLSPALHHRRRSQHQLQPHGQASEEMGPSPTFESGS